MKRKQIVLAAAVTVLAGSASITGYAGSWEQQREANNAWRYREDGSYIRNSWKEIDGTWYYFDGNCHMVIGSYLIDGKTERFDQNGAWIKPSEGQNNIRTEKTTEEEGPGPGTGGWEQDGRGWYYRNFDGSRERDSWKEIKGSWYYFDGDGYIASDAWIDTNGVRYRVSSDGSMVKNQKIVVDGLEYKIDENGAVQWEGTGQETEESLQAKAIAAQIVASITNDSMTKAQKANAIYDYVRRSTSYTYGGPRPEGGEAAAALYGFRRHYGNCFEYYSMSKYLLEAAGMENIMVTRASDRDHFWNLVNVDGAWYHFDTTPRRTGGRWCLVTTEQLRGSWGAHNFDVNAYPATP